MISRARRISNILKELETGKLYLKEGNLYRSDTGKLASHDNRGYRGLTRRIEGKQVWVMEHHVLYCLYNDLEDIPKGLDVNHIDFNRCNNREENLELLTRQQNIRHSMEAGRMADKNKKMKENNIASKLTKEEVLQIKDLATHKVYKQYEIAKIYGVRPNQISRIKTGQQWSWVN